MSTERDELALVLANAQRVRNGSSPLPSADHCSRLAFDEADAILAAGYRKPRQVTTVEQIKELPALTVVLHDDTSNGGPLEAYVVPDDGTVMFKDRYPFHLMTFAGDYIQAGRLPLPLTVVYEAGGSL